MPSLTNQIPDSRATWEVRIAPELSKFSSDALSRLSYLYPSARFNVSGEVIVVWNIDYSEEVRRDIFYALYRSKIASEGAELRSLLYNAVLGQ